ncbi:hypothetical protein [Rhodoferax sp. UBA5149]|uniref:hypothetical protein n=1 Tax=Rhodoferax sp. UBA5149 TaxID=1947379 RepID=UPI0025E523A3|nr:hypothetical protein [Rhodoferax sp. UBA5149]
MMKLCRSTAATMLARGCGIAGFMVISLFFSFGRVDAQGLRDPTVPPAEAGYAGTASGEKFLGIEPGAMTVIVRNGRPYLVVGTRLYAQGQKLGQARIERISETEVWLREGGVLRKVHQFPGIQRRTVAPSSKTHSPVAPRADVQP